MPDPAHRTDVQRMTAAEIRHCMLYGLTILSDEEVNRRRDNIRESLRPSIEDYLTQEEINRIQCGGSTNVEILLHPEEWDGIGRQHRDALLQANEDALLLGIHFEEMNGLAAAFARHLRAELNTIRVVGNSVDIQTVYRP